MEKVDSVVYSFRENILRPGAIHFLNKKLKVQSSVSREVLENYTAQGMGSDSKYIYFPMSGSSDNILAVYDWDGNFVRTVSLPTTVESESMFFVNGTYYVNFYVAGGNGARLCRLRFSKN